MPNCWPRLPAFLAVLGLGVLPLPVLAAEPEGADQHEFFEKQVRPLLVERCGQCHGEIAKPKGKLKLTSRAAVLKGGKIGPAAVPGKPQESLLLKAVHYQDDELKMPPTGKLADREIATLQQWIQMGLPWPDSKPEEIAAVKPGPGFRITDEQRRFWSFQPVKAGAPPAVKDGAWPHSDIDRFILAALEAKALKPAPAADKRTLLRRATFDLTGLPPTPQEIDAFLADTSPDAFARVIDRLLASPAYGERWGRHWLDVVRYTDSADARGVGDERDFADSFRYRDWVVNAFNADLPYDQFIINQVAGDLLPPRSPGGINRDGTIATGMLAIGNWGGGDADKEKLLTDIADDQVDVVSRSFMGLTVACARCHDHKFDPIATADYYGLAGIFFSTHILPNVGPKTNGPPILRIPLSSPEEIQQRERHAARVAELEKQLQAATADRYRQFARSQLSQTARYVQAVWEYQHRPASQAKMSLAELATGRGLHEYALRRWSEALALEGGDYRAMMVPVRDIYGHAGVHAWRGADDCPSLTVNTTSEEVSILTFKLPPRSVAVHPGPRNGVGISWKSPIAGTVRLSGRVLDADPVGGDGIAWIIDHRSATSWSELASGEIANGGRQRFDQGKSPERLTAIPVKAGDELQLLVLPRANHSFDTTVVELTIARQDGSASWDVTRDLLADPLQGNPHSDSQGHAGVWKFLDMADSNRSRTMANQPEAFRTFRSSTADQGSDVERAAQELQQHFTLTDAGSPFWIEKVENEKVLPEPDRSALAKLRQELQTLKKNPPPLSFANGAQEGGVPGSPQAGVHDVRIHIRGSYARLGDLVPRHFPTIVAGDHQAPITEGSGRLQLARWLASAEHPLTARVMVNRIWQYHFGEGLVRTPSNFGKQGERPTHPELLDWLAKTFIDSGWSIKAMHRAIMLSAVYQQSSIPLPETLKADPENRLLGRMNRRRLEAEAVRDSLLSASGRLERKMGGLATRDFKEPRRTLYLMTIRSDRSGFGPLFDVADPTASVDKRTVSTVAPQALFLMNHPFVLEETRILARRILSGGGSDRENIERAYVLLYGRPPAVEETRVGEAFLQQGKAQGEAAEATWEAYGQVLLCANEFIYID